MNDRNPTRDIYHSGGPPSAWQLFLDELTKQPTESMDRLGYDLGGDFIVALRTDVYAPAHTITLRNERDGWLADVRGEYWRGNWIFRIDPKRYPKLLLVKFALDGLTMTTEAIRISIEPDVTQRYRDVEFVFPVVPKRYAHGFDNLDVTASKVQAELVPGNRDESIEYDVIIVGSGMGGGVLADTLSDCDVKTLVLEAGNLVFQTHIDSLPGYEINFSAAQQHEVGHYINRPHSNSSFVNSIQMNLGGRSVYWEGLIPRMDEWEFAYWPLRVQQYLTNLGGYRAAEKLVRKQRTLGPFQRRMIRDLAGELDDYKVRDLPRSLHQPNLNARASRVTHVLQRTTGTFSTTDVLLDSLSTDPYLGRNYLTVNLNHLVTELEWTGDQVTGVVCWDLVGNVRRCYRGKSVVLAAGSLESPRIAMASELADSSRKIGIGLTDHPAFVQPIAVPLQDTSPYAGHKNHAKVLIRHLDGAAHPYSMELVISPQYWDVRHSDDDVLRLAMESTDKTYATVKFLFDATLNDNNKVTYLGPGQKLEIFVEPDTSALTQRAEVQSLRNRIFTFLEADYDPNRDLDYHGNGSVHHAGGTLRMSDNASGVVNDDLRFEAYTNLYCCDVSVFPRIPTANPSLTLIALAQRLACHLTRQSQSP